jgi:hypothetical protein
MILTSGDCQLTVRQLPSGETTSLASFTTVVIHAYTSSLNTNIILIRKTSEQFRLIFLRSSNQKKKILFVKLMFSQPESG